MFKKQNFTLWVKIATAISKDYNIHVYKGDISFSPTERKQLHKMYHEGYLIRRKTAWNKSSYSFTAKEKFKKEFKEKFCEISKKIAPDFTDEIRESMLSSFKF